MHSILYHPTINFLQTTINSCVDKIHYKYLQVPQNYNLNVNFKMKDFLVAF